jgi:hypothetical protein
MNPSGNFPKNSLFFVVSVAKAKKHRHSLPCFLAIFAWTNIVLTAMKRGDEALNASLLQFLSIVKRFIATLNVSSPLISIGKDRLTLHRRYF